MKNLVDKYTVEATTETEDGVVAIEYVVVAAAVVAGLATIFGLFGGQLTTKLGEIITSIGGE